MTPTILHLITGLGTGGAERQLSQLVTHSGDFRHIVVSMTSLGELGPALRRAGVPVYALDMARARVSPNGLFRLLRIIADEKPALIQTWLYHADLLGLLVGTMAGRRPVVWNIRCSDMDFTRYSRLTALVVRLLAKLSPLPAAVVHNARAGRAVHEAIGYRARRWEFIGNGFDLDRFKPDAAARAAIRRELGVAPEARLVGLIARFDPMKDHGNFLAAAGEVAQALPDVRFLMAGTDVDVANGALNALISQAGLGGKVFALGRREDVSTLTAALDLAVSSSAFGEGFPNSLGEALCSGVCCVTTAVGDSALVVGEFGHVVAPRNPSALAQAMRSMLELAPEVRRELGLKAREHMEHHFAVPTIVGRYQRLYKNVLQERGMRCAD